MRPGPREMWGSVHIAGQAEAPSGGWVCGRVVSGSEGLSRPWPSVKGARAGLSERGQPAPAAAGPPSPG